MSGKTKKFGEHEAKGYPHPLHEAYRIEFENGYGASIVRGFYTRGGHEGLWELAVLTRRGLETQMIFICYDTEITDDVLGHLSEAEVAVTLDRIQALKRRVQV